MKPTSIIIISMILLAIFFASPITGVCEEKPDDPVLVAVLDRDAKAP
jgi:hypothetical protein